MPQRTKTVRLESDLIPLLEKVVKNERDELGRKKYRSVCHAVTEAVVEFLKKHREI